jgi:hypothetical protein
MRRIWYWLLYRVGVLKPPPLTELVVSAIRANPEHFANEAAKHNALLRSVMAKRT